MNNPAGRGTSDGLDCKGELLTRVLRGGASSVDQRAFEAHVEYCESCRLSHELCRDFEQMGAAADDSARIAHMTAASLQRRRSAGAAVVPLKRRQPLLRLALVALLMGGSAAAAFVPWLGTKGPLGTGDGAQSRPPLAPSTPASPKTAPPPPAAPETASEQPGVLPSEPRAPGLRSLGPEAASKVAPRERDAQSLFRDASQARRSGKTSTAIELYRQLQQQFPQSPEALLSRVSLGGLLLERGSSAAALAQFDEYLGARAGKSLAAEALFGRGRALHALGRTSAEKENWRRLLDSYPSSPYSDEVQRRLQTLP